MVALLRPSDMVMNREAGLRQRASISGFASGWRRESTSFGGGAESLLLRLVLDMSEVRSSRARAAGSVTTWDAFMVGNMVK